MGNQRTILIRIDGQKHHVIAAAYTSPSPCRKGGAERGRGAPGGPEIQTITLPRSDASSVCCHPRREGEVHGIRTTAYSGRTASASGGAARPFRGCGPRRPGRLAQPGFRSFPLGVDLAEFSRSRLRSVSVIRGSLRVKASATQRTASADLPARYTSNRLHGRPHRWETRQNFAGPDSAAFAAFPRMPCARHSNRMAVDSRTSASMMRVSAARAGLGFVTCLLRHSVRSVSSTRACARALRALSGART